MPKITTKIAITLIVGVILCGLTLPAQEHTSRKNPARAEKSSATFAVRSKSPEPIKSLSSETSRDDEPIYDQEFVNFAFPLRAGLGPHAPIVCRHNDMSRDMEFRLCMSQLLDTSESFRNGKQLETTDNSE